MMLPGGELMPVPRIASHSGFRSWLHTLCWLWVTLLGGASFSAAAGGSPTPQGQPVEFRSTGHQIDVLIGGQPFTTFFFGSESPKPYLHPLRSARGTIVTRGWPMVTSIPGE